MTLEELLSFPIDGKNVLVLGSPASGKTHIAKLLCDSGTHQLIQTDDTINAGYTIPQAIWSIFEDISDCNNRSTPTIVEGVLGYSLLLEGAKHMAYSPDVVIEVKISRGRQREIYLRERDAAKLKYLKKFEEQHLLMMNEFYRIYDQSLKIKFLTVENEWNYATEVTDK